MKIAPVSLPLSRWALIATLVLITVSYRVIAAQVPALSNTSPLMAIAFGGAMLLGRKAWFLPLFLLVLSDLVLGWLVGTGWGAYTVMSALIYLIVGWAARQYAGSQHPRIALIGGTLLSGVFFYLIANTFSWALAPEYTKTLSGWWQSQTTGLPQYSPPSWFFLRQSLLADTVWCILAGWLFFRSTEPTAAKSSTEALQVR